MTTSSMNSRADRHSGQRSTGRAASSTSKQLKRTLWPPLRRQPLQHPRQQVEEPTTLDGAQCWRAERKFDTVLSCSGDTFAQLKGLNGPLRDPAQETRHLHSGQANVHSLCSKAVSLSWYSFQFPSCDVSPTLIGNRPCIMTPGPQASPASSNGIKSHVNN